MEFLQEVLFPSPPKSDKSVFVLPLNRVVGGREREALCSSAHQRSLLAKCEQLLLTALTSDESKGPEAFQTSYLGLGCHMWNRHGRYFNYSLTWRQEIRQRDIGYLISRNPELWDLYMNSHISSHLSKGKQSPQSKGKGRRE